MLNLFINSNIKKEILWLFLSFIYIIVPISIIYLPNKYKLVFSLGFVFANIFIFLNEKIKKLVIIFIVSLPIGMGYELLKFETINKSNIIFQIYLSDIILLMIFIFLFFEIFINKKSRILKMAFFRNKISMFFVFWFFMCATSLFFAIDASSGLVGILRISRILLTYYVFFFLIMSTKDIRFISIALLFSMLIQSILIFGQYLTGSQLVYFPGMTIGEDMEMVAEGFRPSGTLGHSSHFAKLSGILLPISLGLALFCEKKMHRWSFLLVWLIGSLALALTLSRAGLLTWFFSIVLYFTFIAYFKSFNIQMKLQKISIALLILCGSLTLIFFLAGENIVSRFNDDSGSLAARYPMFVVSLEVIKKNPIFGVGLKNYTYVHQEYDDTEERISHKLPDSPVHNLFLLYAAEIGLPGAFAFLGLLYLLVKGCLMCAQKLPSSIDKGVFVAIAIGILSISLQSLTGKGVVDNLTHLSVIAIFAACVAKQSAILAQYDRPR